MTIKSGNIPHSNNILLLYQLIGVNVKFFLHFISFFCDVAAAGCSTVLRKLGELGAILGELAYILVGLGIKIWVQVGDGMKDLFFMDERNLKIIFSGV